MNRIGEELMNLLASPYLWSALGAYLIGQTMKIILQWHKGKKLTIRDFFASGNMPSTHTASIVALTTVIGFANGFDSAIFALALLMTAVIGYDASHVRRAVGEHGLVLRELIDRDHNQEKLLANLSDELLERGDTKAKKSRAKGKLVKPYFSRGHLPREVIAGAILGVVTGVVVSLIWGLL